MNDIACIPLKHGGFAIVDADMFPQLNQHRWTKDKRGYVFRYLPRNGGKVVIERMHRVVNGTTGNIKTDHKNRYTFDNTRRNLRDATESSNGANAPKRAKNASSKYKGVTWHKRSKRWKAILTVNGREYTCACVTERQAALAYNDLAKFHFGYFALLNEVDGVEPN